MQHKPALADGAMLPADLQDVQLPGLKEAPEHALHRDSQQAHASAAGQEPTMMRGGLIQAATDLPAAERLAGEPLQWHAWPCCVC